jgi:FMN phosphatase YigB (HAD superfamily)
LDKPAAVFFDLDNTLYDHRRAAREALAEIYRRYDVAASGAPVDEFIRRFFDVNQRMWLKLAAGELDVATLRGRRFAEVFAAVGAAPPADAAALGQEYLDIYLTLSYPLPGAEETLAALEPLLPLGLLTNGFTDIQRPKIARLGWEKYFAWVARSTRRCARWRACRRPGSSTWATRRWRTSSPGGKRASRPCGCGGTARR